MPTHPATWETPVRAILVIPVLLWRCLVPSRDVLCYAMLEGDCSYLAWAKYAAIDLFSSLRG
eukprot:6224902-Pyramimonas_sp.AAC.1